MKRVAVIDKGEKNIFISFDGCNIIRVCNLKDIENDIKLTEFSRYNFFRNGFFNIPDTNCCAILIDLFKNKEEYSGFIKNLQKFERKDKLKKLMVC